LNRVAFFPQSISNVCVVIFQTSSACFLKDISCGTKLLHINSSYINTQQFLTGFNQLARHVKNIQWWRVEYLEDGIWKQECCGVDL